MIVPRLRNPIVLVHGLMGFDRLRIGPVVMDYFRKIPTLFRSGGNRVLVARVSPTRGIAERARELKTLLDRQFSREPVHLIAHSMGGLDARYLISRLGMANRVLSLTTLGTPHRGTMLADLGLRRLERFLRPLFGHWGVSIQGLCDLTRASCAEFNRTTPDAPGVRYFSVAGRFHLDWRAPQWALPGHLLEIEEGPNDGLVSLISARYGEGCEEWDSDHMELVNWPRLWKHQGPRERTSEYIGLVRRLADEGF